MTPKVEGIQPSVQTAKVLLAGAKAGRAPHACAVTEVFCRASDHIGVRHERRP